MTWLLVAVGASALWLPGASAAWNRRLLPPLRARITATSLALGLVGLSTAVMTTLLPSTFRAAGWPELAAACQRAFGLPAGGTVPAVAVSVFVVLIAALLIQWRTTARLGPHAAYVEPWLALHQVVAGHDVAIIPVDQLLAYSVDRPAAQIVVSERLVESLSSAELETILRHELSHLRHRHHRYLRLASTIDRLLGKLPGARTSTAVLRVALERWADEEATGTDSTRRTALRSALLAAAWGVTPATSAGARLENVDALAERLDALAGPAPAATPTRGIAAWIGVSALGGIGVAALAQCLANMPAVAAAVAARCCGGG